MGLAEQKNRTKLSNDPQNTAWANNTERFGHRILTGQGWAPGKSLGAKDAAHAAHYTAASQSHIRVFLKDDNLGLGAKRGSERAENFGLAGLESILGRLNGREEDVKKEEARREEVEKRAYVYRKYGLMNFVSGGFLVGDRIVDKHTAIKAEPAIEVKTEIKSEPESDSSEDKKKKRKRDTSDAAGEGTEDQAKLKRKKKSMDLREEASKQSGSEKSKKDKKDKKDKKEKKDKSKKSKDKSATSDPEPMTDDAPTPASDPEPLTDKARRKAEKKVRKEEKKLKKALKKAAKKAAKANDSADDSSSESDDDDTPSSSTPATGASTPTMFAGRGVQAARHRHIMMKKRASMDPQALKEIFMIKTPA